MCKKIFILTLFLLLFVSSRQVCGQESFYDAKVSEYGQLDEALGDKWNGIDSLIVHGPMDSLDFKVIVRCAKEGRVRVVNLQYAQVKGHRIPDEAFLIGICTKIRRSICRYAGSSFRMTLRR